ncbi:MAG: ASPIC/UnbV domain-containing protein [Vicinamibacterales bacterium]
MRVLDAAGHATLAGAEVRVFAAGTTRLAGARLVDAGSGYDAQSDMPVHIGVPAGMPRVDVQLIVPRGGRRTPVWVRNVDVARLNGKPLDLRAR